MNHARLAKYVFSLAMLSVSLEAVTYTVNQAGDTLATPFGTFAAGSGDLRGCLSQIDTQPSGPFSIVFNLPGAGDNTIALAYSLPVINGVNTANVTIDGSNTLGGSGQIIVNGTSNFRAFLVNQGTVSIQNMTIENTLAEGGVGSGGGMGAGAAVFVNSSATVTLQNLAITSANATGGTGGFGGTFPNGGGGMGGDGGTSPGNNVCGGGGGLGGDGGTGALGAGGGGGGGVAAEISSNTGAGGYNSVGVAGGIQGGASGGRGDGNGNLGGANGGGGGSGPLGGTGGGGGVGGSSGGGGAGGGFGGGGGGSFYGSGGPGGFGGGGGARSGIGGFGGGGGGSPYATTTGAVGGFGGGGGGGLTGGAGGVAGGQGSSTGGGGGAGLGGAIFVRGGGSLSILSGSSGTFTTSGSNVTAGAGASVSATAGAAAGSDIFVQTGSTVNFNPSSGQTISLTGTIGDDSAATLPGPGYTPGASAGGALSVTGPGTVILTGASTYSGGTTVSSGKLQGNTTSLQGSIANTANVTFDQSATGTYAGTMTGSGGTLTKINTGMLILTGPNDYTGGTTVSAGALQGNTTSIQGAIANTASVIFDQSTTGTYAGSMSGSGGTLTKINTGTLILAGTNSYTGGTTVSAGVLQGNTSSIQGAITNTASVVFDQSTTGTYTGAMGGSGGTVVKSGIGTVIFSGTSNYTGTTTINAGALSVTGSITSPVTIGPSGTLKGTGTVNNSVAVNGKLSPGSSIGTLTVNSGNVTYNTGSVFAVEIDPTTASKLVVATGNALVSGASTIQVTEDSGTYTPGTQYTILSTPLGTISNSNLFTVQSVTPGFTFSLLTDATNLYLLLTAVPPPAPVVSPISTVGLSGNSLKMANYLNSLINYEPIQTVLNDLNALSPSQLKKALSTIDPARNTYSTFSLQNIAFIFSDLISSRMNNQRFSQRLNQEEGGSEVAALIAGPIMRTAEKKQCLSYSTWASAFGTFAHEKEQNQTPAFDMNSEGVLVGFDLLGYQHATLGGSLGYARIDIKNDNHFGHQEINDYVASVYGDFSMCDFFLDLAVWGGYHQAKGKRHIFFSGFNETAHSKTHGWQVVPHLMLGYDVETRWFTLEPFAQFDWAVNFEHAFKEYGAAPLNMRQKANTSSLLRSEVGLAAYQTHTSCGGAMLIVKEKLSYVNKKTFHTGRATAAIVGAPGGTFTVDTFTGLQNLISPGLEIFYQTASNVFMSAAYEGEFGSGYRSNSVIAKLGKAF